MTRKQVAKSRAVDPDFAFLDALEIDDEPPLRRLEVYEEARQLRRQVLWLAEEPTSPAFYIPSPRRSRRSVRGSDTRPRGRR